MLYSNYQGNFRGTCVENHRLKRNSTQFAALCELSGLLTVLEECGIVFRSNAHIVRKGLYSVLSKVQTGENA